MKVLLVIVGICITIELLAASKIELMQDTTEEVLTQQMLAKFADVVVRKDANRALSLLTELDSIKIWSFGAGVGPTTSRSLQCSIVRWMCNSGIKIQFAREIEPVDFGLSNSSWRCAFDFTAIDCEGVLGLLHDQNPAKRLLGMRKSEKMQSLEKSICEALQYIAQHDDYFQIVRIRPDNLIDAPPPMGLTLNELVLPLREEATRILSENGILCHQDVDYRARSAVSSMACKWANCPERQWAFEDAISLLNPNGPSALAVRTMGVYAHPKSAYAAFLRAMPDDARHLPSSSAEVAVLLKRLTLATALSQKIDAIVLLGRCRDKTAIPSLIALLQKSKRGSPTDDCEEGSVIRRTVVGALGEIGDASALKDLMRIYEDKWECPSVRDASMEAVRRIKSRNDGGVK